MKNELKTYTIYQVYIRNFNKEGTIKSLIKQLDYIKNLGIKIIQLLPVNEIGLDGRKGVLGSPYAIKDYYKINPELGNKEDFDNLIFEAHKRDLLVMMDVVFNHTSRDSVLIKEHPEFYYKDKDGHYANHFGNWSDVYDLDYTNIALHGVCYYTLTDQQEKDLDITCDEGKINVNFFANYEGINIWCSISEDVTEPCFRVSLRSRNYRVDNVAKKFQGGGHGYKLKDVTDFANRYELKKLLLRLPQNLMIKDNETKEIEFKTLSSFDELNLNDGFGLAIDFENVNYHVFR